MFSEIVVLGKASEETKAKGGMKFDPISSQNTRL
jgi:hypothetical protein